MTKQEILDAIKGLNVLELADLVKALEEEFGVSAAPVAVAAGAALAGPAASAAQEEQEEQTEFKVVLKATGANKINVIKAVREVTTLGLKEAKELVESAPATVRDAVAKGEAESIRAKLSEAGATVEVS